MRVQLLELESERRKFERLLQVATPAALSGLPASLLPGGATQASSNKSSTDDSPASSIGAPAAAASDIAPQPNPQPESQASSSGGSPPPPPVADARSAVSAAPARRHAPAPPRRALPRPATFEQSESEPRLIGPSLGPFAQRASDPSSEQHASAIPARRIDIPAVSARDDAGVYEDNLELK